MDHFATIRKIDPEIALPSALTLSKGFVWIFSKINALRSTFFFERLLNLIFELQRDGDSLDVRMAAFGTQAADLEEHGYSSVFRVDTMQGTFEPIDNSHYAKFCLDVGVSLLVSFFKDRVCQVPRYSAICWMVRDGYYKYMTAAWNQCRV